MEKATVGRLSLSQIGQISLKMKMKRRAKSIEPDACLSC